MLEMHADNQEFKISTRLKHVLVHRWKIKLQAQAFEMEIDTNTHWTPTVELTQWKIMQLPELKFEIRPVAPRGAGRPRGGAYHGAGLVEQPESQN